MLPVAGARHTVCRRGSVVNSSPVDHGVFGCPVPTVRMEPIRVVWGTGHGPTELAAYDAALAAANLHQYNLLRLSSVIPAAADVTESGTAPDLGPTGGGLPVVEAAATTNSGPVSAALAWVQDADGAGIFYEAAGPTEPMVVSDRVLAGLESGAELRSLTAEPEVRVATTENTQPTDGYASVVVAAAYGSTRSLLKSDR